jgi:hypothetical protein
MPKLNKKLKNEVRFLLMVLLGYARARTVTHTYFIYL